MKHLFNNISQEEKNRILEMHGTKVETINEQDDNYGGRPPLIHIGSYNKGSRSTDVSVNKTGNKYRNPKGFKGQSSSVNYSVQPIGGKFRIFVTTGAQTTPVDATTIFKDYNSEEEANKAIQSLTV